MEPTDYYAKQLIGNMCIYTIHWLQSKEIPVASIETNNGNEVYKHVEDQNSSPVSTLLVLWPITKNPLAPIWNSSQKSLVETSNLNWNELESYYLYQLTEAEQRVKPTEFWISKQSAWPILSTTAIHILSAETTSCESEQTFSFLGNLCQDK